LLRHPFFNFNGTLRLATTGSVKVRSHKNIKNHQAPEINAERALPSAERRSLSYGAITTTLFGPLMHVLKSAQLSWHVAREAGASLLTYELYPLGLAGTSLPALPRLWSRNSPKRSPVLFIHGILHNPSAFVWLLQRLASAGWRDFAEMNLYTMFHSIPKMAEQTASNVDALLKRYHVKKVDIIAHSMGGIVARYYIQHLAGDRKVKNLITLGTPHQGTALSQMVRLNHIRELLPNSLTLNGLNQCPLPQRTQCLSISGSLDVMVKPANAFWPGVRNVELRGVGHAGLLFSRRVVNLVVGRLS
jgi:hypothetical protein